MSKLEKIQYHDNSVPRSKQTTIMLRQPITIAAILLSTFLVCAAQPFQPPFSDLSSNIDSLRPHDYFHSGPTNNSRFSQLE